MEITKTKGGNVQLVFNRSTPTFANFVLSLIFFQKQQQFPFFSWSNKKFCEMMEKNQ